LDWHVLSSILCDYGWNVHMGVFSVCTWGSSFFTLFSFRMCRKRTLEIFTWSWIGVLVSIWFWDGPIGGLCRNEQEVFEQPISALTGQIPVFLKPLWAFAMVAAFPHAVEKSEVIWYCHFIFYSYCNCFTVI
jgi:hypothetical protein